MYCKMVTGQCSSYPSPRIDFCVCDENVRDFVSFQVHGTVPLTPVTVPQVTSPGLVSLRTEVVPFDSLCPCRPPPHHPSCPHNFSPRPPDGVEFIDQPVHHVMRALSRREPKGPWGVLKLSAFPGLWHLMTTSTSYHFQS